MTMIRHEKAKTIGFFIFFYHQSIFRFQDFLYQTLFKDDSQLCYKIYNRMIMQYVCKISINCFFH